MLSALQQYLRRAAAHDRSVIRSGPFRVHVDAHSDQPYANYAIPDADAAPGAAEVAALLAVFAGRGRRAALEYLPACAPAVERPLLDAGLEVTLRTPVLACPAARLVTVATPAGVELVVAGPATGDELLHELIAMQGAAFGAVGMEVPSDEEVRRVRERAGEGVVVFAREDGVIVGGGTALAFHDGITELVGIAVAAHARRRGIAAALTSALAREAVARGARLPFLTPGDDHADRAYRRAGFAPVGEMLHLAAG